MNAIGGPSKSATRKRSKSSKPKPKKPRNHYKPNLTKPKINPSDSDPLWHQLFRMSKPSFLNLLSLLSSSLHSLLPPSIPPESAVAAAVFRLAHGSSYETSARRFMLDSSLAARIAFISVCKVIIEKLESLVQFGHDIDNVIMGFDRLSFPNCCGVLGFAEFVVNHGDLSNGSLLVQGLVDSEGTFMDISVGWPCTMKLNSIFCQTSLYKRIEDSKELLKGSCYRLIDGNLVPQYILSDSCLPMLPWLLTPYNSRRASEKGDNFASAERGFNASHSRAMKVVNTAFQRVKSVWQLLAAKLNDDPVEIFPFMIVMGCVLHNYLIKCREHMPDEESVETWPVFEAKADERSWRIRDMLAIHLSRASTAQRLFCTSSQGASSTCTSASLNTSYQFPEAVYEDSRFEPRRLMRNGKPCITVSELLHRRHMERTDTSPQE